MEVRRTSDDLETAKARKRTWPLVASLFFAAFLVLIFRWFASEVGEGETEAFDHAVRNFVHEFATPVLTSVVKIVSFTGKAAVLTGLGTIVAAVLAYLRFWRDIALLLITMGGEIVLELMLKASYQRARPDTFFDLPAPESYSFPSGHALGSLCFYGIAAYIISRRVSSPRTKAAIALAAAAWVSAVGFSRVYLGVHYPSDVLGGYFVGIIWLAAVITFDRYLTSSSSRPPISRH
jgi:membrane-associated phospholipid phosphatase